MFLKCLFLVCVDNSVSMEELLEEIEALKDTLLQQNNYLSSFANPPRNGRYWHYVPPYQNVSYHMQLKVEQD